MKLPNLVDLGTAAIIPGLVNAHTHLEFSHLQQPLGKRSIEFTDWIRAIVDSRQQDGADPNQKRKSIQEGLRESFQSGVWCIGEIATVPVCFDDYRMPEAAVAEIYLGAEQPGDPTSAGRLQSNARSDSQRWTGRSWPKVVPFLEQLGRRLDEFPNKQEQVIEFLSKPHDEVFKLGLSPHAPYSVHPELLDWLCQTAVAHQVPVAMHLAESPAELELLKTGTGPFSRLLHDFGIWENESQRETRNVLEIMQRLATTPRSLVIHGNYLQPDEVNFIAENRDRMSVVYCPRTSDYFEHGPHPLNALLESAINVAVGTDSRASNPDLNLFQDLKFIARTFPQLDSTKVLEMGTINGARALGVENEFGSIAPGKSAAISVIQPTADHHVSDETYDWLFAESMTCRPLTR